MGDFALCIDPSEREYRESEPVAVAFAELAFSVRLEQERQVRETRHRVFPAKSLVEHVVQRQ